MKSAVAQIDIEGALATVMLNRPPVNALDHSTMSELALSLRALAANESISVVVFRGAGRGFSAGADLNSAGDRPAGGAEAGAEITTNFYRAIYEMPCATIAAIHGYAIGAGLSIGALCDIRVATQETFFSMPEVHWGFSVGGGGSKIARLGVSTGFLREMMMSGRRITAPEALDVGLIDYMTSTDGLNEKLHALASSIAKHDARSVRLVKEGLNAAEREGEWERGYRATAPLSRRIAAAADPKVRTSQFFTDRDPNF